VYEDGLTLIGVASVRDADPGTDQLDVPELVIRGVEDEVLVWDEDDVVVFVSVVV